MCPPPSPQRWVPEIETIKAQGYIDYTRAPVKESIAALSDHPLFRAAYAVEEHTQQVTLFSLLFNTKVWGRIKTTRGFTLSDYKSALFELMHPYLIDMLHITDVPELVIIRRVSASFQSYQTYLIGAPFVRIRTSNSHAIAQALP